MSAKFAECTLGQLYRVTDADGHVLGGPMRYLRVGLKEIGLGPLGNVLAGLFMILCIGASFGGGNAFQVGQSLDAIRGDEGLLVDSPWIYGIAMADRRRGRDHRRHQEHRGGRQPDRSGDVPAVRYGARSTFWSATTARFPMRWRRSFARHSRRMPPTVDSWACW